eukprot:TRINITY_DN84510_c0_g1_i1.p1 TRINITY_DN84510_c0_g1~~TRINITY_DN84510_c0_g1_i1.p1  ORF type:complete len:112 (+),score=20.82 TRINITY_DN84510_c0_g1_i1:94-429(+)
MVKLWMIFVGLGLVGHAATVILAEKRAALETVDALAMDQVYTVSSQVVLQVIIGSFLALWGGIGDFKPIRLGDPKRQRWEAAHARPEFHSYRNRGKFMKPLLTKIPAAPTS